MVVAASAVVSSLAACRSSGSSSNSSHSVMQTGLSLAQLVAKGNWSSYIVALKHDTGAYDSVRAKYDSHSPSALQALEATSSNTESNRQGTNLGLTSCVAN